jgi:hypothetical protein
MYVLRKHVALQKFVQGEAKAYSSDENDLSGLTQNVFCEQSSLPESNVFSDIFDSEWSNLENVKEIELNVSEPCADGNENPILEGSTISRNITVISDSELEERKGSRIPANMRMSTTSTWATGVWKDWVAERNRKVTTAHSTEETVNGDLLANTDEQLNKWLRKFVMEV